MIKKKFRLRLMKGFGFGFDVYAGMIEVYFLCFALLIRNNTEKNNINKFTFYNSWKKNKT